VRNFEAWLYKGYLHSAYENYKEAIICYDKSIELYPNNPQSFYYKACDFSLLKNKREMLENLSKAIALENTFKMDAAKNKDFKRYWSDPDFKKIIRN